MESSRDFSLKRSIRPYMGYLVIFGVFTIVGLLSAIASKSLSPLGIIAFCWILFMGTRFADLRYRISWKDGVIKQIATDKSVTVIKVSQISHIEREGSNLATLLTFSRPARRITIYGNDGERIDVSLKHFAPADINRLMEEIHKERNDLIVPKA